MGCLLFKTAKHRQRIILACVIDEDYLARLFCLLLD
jgi:hypothetical protein